MLSAKDTRIPFLLAGAIWFAALALDAAFGIGERMEYPFLDWSLRGLARQSPPDSDIVLLDIDEPTLEAMAPEYGRYPWTRAVYGTLIDGLARQKPAAIVFDILFTDPHKEHAADDLYLIRAARRTPNVFFAMLRLPGGAPADATGVALRELNGIERTAGANEAARAALALPLPGLAATGRIGAINATPDADAVYRRAALYHDVGGWRIPSLPARVARELGYALPPAPSIGLVWHGVERSYQTVPLHEVLFDLERRRPQRPAHEFTGKIVVIGASAPALGDLKLTPMSALHPGSEVLATMIDNLKNGEHLTFAPRWSPVVLTAVTLVVLASAFAFGVGVLPLGALALTLTAGLAAAGWTSVAHGRFAFPVTLPVVFGIWTYYLPIALRAWLLERRDRQRVTQLFGRFLDPRVVADLVTRRNIATGGERREITVLFSDIRGFTTLSERKSPQQVVELLNRYFRLQVEVIFRHQGTLDKYIGDAIMAFWGAPTAQPDHARRALEAARDMVRTLARFKRELGAAGAGFDVGIGLCSGEAVVGFIGSPQHRQDYTVIGDTVNTASRIEGATKDRARVLVSDTTRAAAGSACQFRDHGRVALKGKVQKVRLYEPMWESNDENSDQVDGPRRRVAGRGRAGKGNRHHAR